MWGPDTRNVSTHICIHKCPDGNGISPYPQATSLTRPCPPLASYLGSKESSAMPTTLVFNTPPAENLPVLCPTTTTPCKHNELEVETALTVLLTVLYLCSHLHIWVFPLKQGSLCAFCGFLVCLSYTGMSKSFFWVTQSFSMSVVSGRSWTPWATSWTPCAPALKWSQVSDPGFGGSLIVSNQFLILRWS